MSCIHIDSHMRGRGSHTAHKWPATPQGALGVNTSLFAFSFVVCNFLSNATTPLVAGALSKGDKQQVCPNVPAPQLHSCSWLAELWC
jgi:Na+-driven multidrug efflux pump